MSKKPNKERAAIRGLAAQIALANPKLRDYEVNAILRQRFKGKWLKATTLATVRVCTTPDKEELFGKLTEAGFTSYEANILIGGLTVGTEEPAIQRTIDDRRKWIRELEAAGQTRSQILQTINRFYRRKDQPSPFDFVEQAYRPMRKKRMTLDQYRSAAARRPELERLKVEAARRRKADRAAGLYRGRW